ncbi:MULTISPECIES: hypothetical protein [Nostoc]|uniref:AMIN domain-containing protein n=1 Tax=Nostoc paludosum FACHB-159 TaxID=2692908 RepID=A0ABR8K9W9_9NOSO|nr:MULTISPECIES: hypothetical protein [Nostoc]MBD2679547.1 hypothetical protein [Nostoc sp. FACHB-857]MBD2735805.1 hypothetical protein [Nostoc paludosum FACHB-159]
MINNYPVFRKSAEFLGAICGGLLITLPAIPQAVAQQSTPRVNPCPSIFYEEPHNSRVVVPQGCPPNALTQRLAAQGLLPVPATPSPEQARLGVGGEESPVPSQPGAIPPSPVPPTQGQVPPTSPQPGAIPPSQGQVPPTSPQPGATVPVQPAQTPNITIALTNSRVDIKLVNDTAANVTYQVIGDTAPRLLRGKSSVTLQRLTVPVSVTFQREDGGQLTVTPQTSSEAGTLEVTFNETADASQGRSALRIEQNGSVFFN